MSNRRAMPRLRMQFPTPFSVSSTLQGLGVLLDLSIGGCRIESRATVEPGISLGLHIYAPDLA
ncbi:MAG TPA: PilZ domain-containing protein [Nitrospiraceae bacterium]